MSTLTGSFGLALALSLSQVSSRPSAKTSPVIAGHLADVQLAMARSNYEVGEYKAAADQFVTFIVQHPQHRDVGVAAQLAMDCYDQLDDLTGELELAKRLLGEPELSEAVKAQITSQQQGLLGRMTSIGGLGWSKDSKENENKPQEGESFDAAETLKKVAEQNKGTPVGEQALYVAITTYAQRKDLARLRETGTQFLQEYPKSKYAADTYAVMGRDSLESADFDGAADDYEAYFNQFSNDGNARTAMKTAAEIRENTGNYAKAIEDLEKLAAQSSEARVHIAELKVKSGATDEALLSVEKALRADPSNAKVAALLGRILLSQGKTAEAEKRLWALTKPILKNLRSSDPVATEAASEVFFLLGEAFYKDFSALGAKDLDKKAALMQDLMQAYTAAARTGSGQWAVGGLYRLGLAYSALASDILQTPGDAKVVAKQAAEIKGDADTMFSTCVRKSRELEVYNAFVLGCVQKGPVDESNTGNSSGTADQNKVKGFQEVLSKNPNDIDALENLGATYLQAGDYHRALLTYTREVQVNGTKGSAYAGIGMSHEKMGELGDAHDAFAKALDVDPTDDLSHADMAGLKCRFGDIEGAKAELSKLHGAPTQVTPVLDPNWSACGSASAHGETP